MSPSNPTEAYILATLDRLDISYVSVSHEPTHSCEESMAVRAGLGLSGLGSKNILFHAKGKWYLVVTHADRSIKARNFKQPFGTKDIRFATDDELGAIMSARPGSIPPWCEHPELPIFVDAEIFAHDTFLFNPGNPTRSIALATADLRRVYESLPCPPRYFRVMEDGTYDIDPDPSLVG